MAGFVCIYYGNTGSSWLLAALDGSKAIWVPGFEPVEGWAWDAPPEERLDWLETMLSPPADRQGADFAKWLASLGRSPQVEEPPDHPDFLHIGVKMTDLAVSHTDQVIDIVDRTGADVIHLSRSNRLKHALSLYRYHDEEKSQFHGKERYAPTKVDFGRFRHWLEESERLHGQGVAIGERCVEVLGEDRVFPLTYEEFLDEEGKATTLARLAAFLEIPAEFGDGKYAKATPDSLADAVANYTAFRLRYRFTKYAPYLD